MSILLRRVLSHLRDLWNDFSSRARLRIDDLQNGGKPATEVIAILFELLYHQSAAVSQRAADAIDAVIANCTAADLLAIDHMLRCRAEYTLLKVQPARVRTLSHGNAGPLGLLSSHRDGRVREAAVRELLNIKNGYELPFLLLRLTDWVPQVRRLAEFAIHSRLDDGNPARFARILGLLSLLSRRARLNPEIATAIETLFQSDEGRAALVLQLDSHDPLTRRRAFVLLAANSDSLSPDVIEVLVASRHPSLRLAAVSVLRKRLVGQPLRELLTRFLSDKSPSVRREALYGFAEQLANESAPILHRALFDASPALREIARFYLRRTGFSGFASLYRDHLVESDPQLRVAIAGIGETGSPPDGPLVAPFLKHRVPATRRAALRALGKLSAASFSPQLHAALRDASPSVAKAARDVLESHPELLASQNLAELIHHSPTGPTAFIALSLARSLPRWEDLPLFIRATASTDVRIRDFARDLLLAWRNDPRRLVIRPAPHQRLTLADALEQHSHALSPDLLYELRSALAT